MKALCIAFALFMGPPAETGGVEANDTDGSGDTDGAGDTDGDTDGANDGGTERAPEPEPEPAEPLEVAVAGSAPFIIEGDDGPEGIAISVWNAVAGRAGLTYELEPVDSIATALEGVQSGRYDVAVGPISITSERAGMVSFSQPYYQSPLAIVTTGGSASAFDRIRPFFTKAFAVGVGVLLFVLALVGVAFWLTERKENPEQFPARPIEGIGAGLWLALVTMTTVGYGDKAPITRGGRMVAGVWMLIAMITASSLTASIATAFTLSQLGEGAIESPDELAGHRVAVVGGAPAEAFADGYGARVINVDDVPAGLEAVAEGRVDAFVHDRPVILHELEQLAPEVSDELVIAPGKYDPRGYGFAVPLGSDLVHPIDLAVLEVKESGLLGKLLRD